MERLDPHSFADLTQGRISEVEIDWDVSFTDHKLRGFVILHLAEPITGPLDLDTRRLAIMRISAMHDGQEGDGLYFDFPEKDDIRGECLRVVLDKPTQAIKIVYETFPGATALQWLEGAQTAGGEHPFLFSQCQPHHARSMMPIQDTARARFRYSATVRVDRDLTPVMSAAPGQKIELEDGQVAYSFEMPQPIPSYLLALAVGNL
ncbi:M1 family peptidase, partial [Myxococcota bacterium]|nr:M1 family peptidase [Myxococcota bacterium]